MTHTTPEFDQRIADWLEDDPGPAPGQVRATVLAAIPSIRQRRRGWSPVGGRNLGMPTSLRFAATIALVAVVGVGALAYLGGRPGPGDPTTTSPTASPVPSTSAASTPAPTVL